MSNRTLCVLSKCTVCVFCTLSSVYVCKYVLSICKLFLHCLEHALKNFTHQGTCTGDVTIKVIWFDLCFIFNFLTSPPKHVLFQLSRICGICVCWPVCPLVRYVLCLTWTNKWAPQTQARVYTVLQCLTSVLSTCWFLWGMSDLRCSIYLLFSLHWSWLPWPTLKLVLN